MEQINFYRRVVTLAVCLLLICTTAFAQEQLVTVNLKNASTEKLLAVIENQTTYRFSYRNGLLDKQKDITVSKKDASVVSLLESVLTDKNLAFKVISDESIVISDKEARTAPQVKSSDRKIKITGTVLDETGSPTPGVTVMILGTTIGSATSIDGEYEIIVAQGETLSFSFIGYKTQLIKVGTKTVIDIKFEIESFVGEEVVVIGFGSIKKSSLTGSISVVKAEQLAERPVANIGQALQGVVPGLNLVMDGDGGKLNNPLNFDIRGTGTIGDGSKSSPLVLIDGMEGDMNTLNMQDVESISVMKDAASATIYGSRAPFGVILITTKKGRQGKATVNYNNNFRFSTPNLPEVLDSWRYANYYNDGAQNQGIALPYSQTVLDNIQKYMSGEIDYNTEPRDDDSYYKGGFTGWANNDWFDYMYKDVVFSQEHNMSVSGGNEKIQYYISAGWLDQAGIIKLAEDTYDRLSFTNKINATITDWLKIGSTTRFTRTDYDAPRSVADNVLFQRAYRSRPTTPITFPVDAENPLQYENYGDYSQLAQLQYGGRLVEQKDIITQQFSVTVTPIEGWDIIGELNYSATTNFSSRQYINTYHQTPTGSIIPDGYSTGSDWIEERSNKTNFINPNIYTNYAKEWDSGHSLKATAGMQVESNAYRNIYAYGYDLVVVELPTLDNTTVRPAAFGSYSDWATAGFFGRVNYAYKDKYLLELNARYDGTSRFLEDQRWNIFPSVSAGWNMKKESFLEDVAVVDILKLRGSWGQLGNQNTSSLYPFYQTLSISKNYDWLVNGVEAPIYTSSPSLVSSSLTWETVQSWNVGLDFGFLNNRLTGAFDVYNRKTLDMVGPPPTLPEILGTDVPKINNTDQVSRGWELELSWRDQIESIGLSYGIRGTLADSRRFVTRYPNETMEISKWYDDQEAGLIWGYTTVGIAQSQGEMDAHLAIVDQSSMGSDWKAGDIMYADLDGNGKVDGGEGVLGKTGDKTVIGNSQSRYNYGITLNAAWKGFDFSMFLQGVGKKDLWIDGLAFWGLPSTGLEEHLDYWRPEDTESIFGPNTDAYFPRALYSNNKNEAVQTRYLQNGAYLRLKNLQFGYTLPSSVTDKMRMKSIRIFLSGDNIATFTKLSDIFDPETTGGYDHGLTYPLSKVYSFGVNITL